MLSFTKLTALTGLLAATSQALSSSDIEQRAAPACKDFKIPITASAKNKLIFDPTHDLNTVDGVTSFLGSGAGALGQLINLIPQTKTLPLSARYCAPAANANAPAERKNHVQLLLHGIPYNKDYFSGLGYPAGSKPYSWVDYATAQGYPVLSIDNIGNGNSTVHPDPINTVQQPLETEFVHNLITKLRAGKVGHGVPQAKKVIFVGHSYVSLLLHTKVGLSGEKHFERVGQSCLKPSETALPRSCLEPCDRPWPPFDLTYLDTDMYHL